MYTLEVKWRSLSYEIIWDDDEIRGDNFAILLLTGKARDLEGQWIGPPGGPSTQYNHLRDPLSTIFVARQIFDEIISASGDIPSPPDEVVEYEDNVAIKATPEPNREQERLLQGIIEELLNKLGREFETVVLEGRQILTAEELTQRIAELLLPEILKMTEEEAIDYLNSLPLEAGALVFDATYAQGWARNYVYESLAKELSDVTLREFQNVIKRYFEEPGMTRGDVRQLLEPIFGEKRAEAIAVTEVTRASNMSRKLLQDQLANVGIEMERVWMTRNDELVCPICGPLNEKVEDLWKTRFPDGPPAHPRCRCDSGLQFVTEESKKAVELSKLESSRIEENRSRQTNLSTKDLELLRGLVNEI